MNTRIITEYLVKRTFELLTAKQMATAIGDKEAEKESAIRASELKAFILVAQMAFEDNK